MAFVGHTARSCSEADYELPAIGVRLEDLDTDEMRFQLQQVQEAQENIQAIRESKEAAAELQRTIDARKARVAPLKIASKPTVKGEMLSDLIPLWRRISKPGNRKTIERMQRAVVRFVAAVGDIPARDIRRRDVIALRDRMEAAGELSPNAIQQQLDSLHRLFAVAVQEDKVEANPVTVKANKGAADVDEGRQPFTGEQVRVILTAAAGAKVGPDLFSAYSPSSKTMQLPASSRVHASCTERMQAMHGPFQRAIGITERRRSLPPPH